MIEEAKTSMTPSELFPTYDWRIEDILKDADNRVESEQTEYFKMLDVKWNTQKCSQFVEEANRFQDNSDIKMETPFAIENKYRGRERLRRKQSPEVGPVNNMLDFNKLLFASEDYGTFYPEVGYECKIAYIREKYLDEVIRQLRSSIQIVSLIDLALSRIYVKMALGEVESSGTLLGQIDNYYAFMRYHMRKCKPTSTVPVIENTLQQVSDEVKPEKKRKPKGNTVTNPLQVNSTVGYKPFFLYHCTSEEIRNLFVELQMMDCIPWSSDIGGTDGDVEDDLIVDRWCKFFLPYTSDEHDEDVFIDKSITLRWKADKKELKCLIKTLNSSECKKMIHIEGRESTYNKMFDGRVSNIEGIPYISTGNESSDSNGKIVGSLVRKWFATLKNYTYL